MSSVEQPTATPVAYCRACGKPVYQAAPEAISQGLVYCEQHAPGPRPAAPVYTAGPAASPYSAPVDPIVAGVSPGLAFLLGFIPGVGAVYNGQYAKGLIHAVVTAALIAAIDASDNNGSGTFFGILLGSWFFYMAFEAYHTARRRLLGLPVDEFSSVVPARTTRSAAGPLLLIGIGTLFLLNNLGILDMRLVMRFWPLALIALGAYLLYSRLTERNTPAAPYVGVKDEPR